MIMFDNFLKAYTLIKDYKGVWSQPSPGYFLEIATRVDNTRAWITPYHIEKLSGYTPSKYATKDYMSGYGNYWAVTQYSWQYRLLKGWVPLFSDSKYFAPNYIGGMPRLNLYKVSKSMFDLYLKDCEVINTLLDVL